MSAMIWGWLVPSAYVLIALGCLPFFYMALYRYHQREYTSLKWDASDRAFGIFFAAFGAALWPAFVVLAGLNKWIVPGLERVADTPGLNRSDRKRLRVEQRRIAFDAEIARMDKEAGL